MKKLQGSNKSLKRSKKPLKQQPGVLPRQASIKELRLENLQKPKTLVILYYKEKRLSIPVFRHCDNFEQFIRRNILKFQEEILGRIVHHKGKKKSSSLKEIVAFRTTDRDVLKDYYVWMGRDITTFKLIELQPMWKIPTSRGFCNFEIERCIGYGGFSRVYMARRLSDGGFCALKVIDKKLVQQENRIDMVRNEDEIMRTLNHPFVVSMQGSFETSRHVVFILEYYPGGELFYHLRRIKKMSEAEARFYFTEILLAFEYLHEHKVLYRDIKPENIMMDADGHLVLADFGLAKLGLGRSHKTYSFCGSHQYMAPEMVEEQGHGYMLDYYCLGALLYEFVVGFPPFYSHDKDKIFQSIRHEEVGFPQSTDLSHEIKWIICDLLKKDPRERLGSNQGVREILAHPWLRKINTRAILSKQTDPPLKPNLLEFNVDEKDVPQNDSEIRQLYSYAEVDYEILSPMQSSCNKYEFSEDALKPKHPTPNRSKSKKQPSSNNLKRDSSSNTIKHITSNSKVNVNISINRKIEISPKAASPGKLTRVRSADHPLSKTGYKQQWRESRHRR